MLLSIPAQAQQSPAGGDAPAKSPLSQLGEMSQTASHLHQAAEALHRSSEIWAGVVESLATSLATASSEFDPFGFKTAFRTVHHQSEMLLEQRQIIDDLHQREIKRLRRENQRLKKLNTTDSKKRRKSKRGRKKR